MAMAVVSRQLDQSDVAQPATARLVLRLRPAIDVTRDQFFHFCQLNREVAIERNDAGDIEIMPPAGGETSGRNARVTAELVRWADRDGSGVAFDSSAGFELPNGAVRSPDAAWVAHSRLAAVTAEQGRRFLPLCPDFVVELASPSDSVPALQRKMEEYRTNGARLGWLILADRGLLLVYHAGGAVERLTEPAAVAGDPVLPGFVLDLAQIWASPFDI